MPGQDTGRQGAKDFIGQMLQAFPDLEFEIENEIAEGDTVATVARMTRHAPGELRRRNGDRAEGLGRGHGSGTGTQRQVQ